jgi:hypothetical protein
MIGFILRNSFIGYLEVGGLRANLVINFGLAQSLALVKLNKNSKNKFESESSHLYITRVGVTLIRVLEGLVLIMI